MKFHKKSVASECVMDETTPLIRLRIIGMPMRYVVTYAIERVLERTIEAVRVALGKG